MCFVRRCQIDIEDIHRKSLEQPCNAVLGSFMFTFVALTIKKQKQDR